MPKYLVEMQDGRKFQVEADSPPSEADVLAHLGQTAQGPQGPSALELATHRPTSGGEQPDATDSTLSRVNGMLAPLAHPQTAGDMSALLLPNPIGQSLQLGSEAMRSGLKAHPELTGVTGRLKAGILGIAERWRGPQPLTDQEKAIAGTLKQAPVADAGVTINTAPDVWDRVAAETKAAPAPAAPSAPPLSAADRAQLAKQGYAPETIAKVEQAAAGQPMASHTPESPLRAPRVAIGAERVGREAGLSKEAVRVQTGPVLGEQLGEASPILPRDVLGRIVDTVKALPPAEREAYVQRATSGKAQWQIENIRRTLEHLGLLVPVGVGIGAAVRQQLMDRMRERSSGMP